MAATGLLGIAWISRVPFMWGSTLWDLAFTDRRIVALERQFLSFLKRRRKTLSFPYSDLTRLEFEYRVLGVAASYLHVADRSKYERFRVALFPQLARAARMARPDIAKVIYNGQPVDWP